MKLGLRMLNSGLRHKFRMGLILACAPVFALTAAADNLIGTSVKLRALDKVTATTQDFTVAIGDALNYGSLRVDVKHCEKKPPEEIPETYAFLQIFDNRTNGQGRNVEAEKLFSGWMLASKPAISALDHAVYDIWVLDCNVPKLEIFTRDSNELRQ